MTKRYPMAHKVSIPQRYRPSFDTDIRKTIQAERKRLAAEEACKVVKVPTLVVDTVGTLWGNNGPIYSFNPTRYRKS